MRLHLTILKFPNTLGTFQDKSEEVRIGNENISPNVNDFFLSGISCPNRYIVDETQMERPAATTAKRVACLHFVWCVSYLGWPTLDYSKARISEKQVVQLYGK